MDMLDVLCIICIRLASFLQLCRCKCTLQIISSYYLSVLGGWVPDMPSLKNGFALRILCKQPATIQEPTPTWFSAFQYLKKKIIANSGRSSPQYFTDQHLTWTSTAMYLFISSQFGNHTIGFSQSSGLSTIMEFPFSSALLPLLTLLCLLDIGEVSFNVDVIYIFSLILSGSHFCFCN